MLDITNWKLIMGIVSTIICVIAYVPYSRDIFASKTKPHLYTWLIWAITQGTATAGLIYGGGKFGGLSLIIGTILVCIVFLFTFKYGTKNITKSDTITLIVALLAVVVWWQFKNPLLSVLMVSAIDGIGYIPTFRKSYSEPYSETISFWVLMALSSLFSILANAEYNLLTLTYLTILATANTIVASICIIRRRIIPNAN